MRASAREERRGFGAKPRMSREVEVEGEEERDDQEEMEEGASRPERSVSSSRVVEKGLISAGSESDNAPIEA